MKKITFDKGIAFICEGDTEKEFYLSMLTFLCNKYNAIMEKQEPQDVEDVIYQIQVGDTCLLVKFYCANTVSGIPKAGKWFEAECLKKYGARKEWEIFLCYDTDSHNNTVSQFQEGDWQDLREKLSKAKKITDLAAAADIEDIMLVDLQSICDYLKIAIVSYNDLKGRKGYAKMKYLYRGCGKSYHKGKRARPMIDYLNKQKIIDSGVIPLCEIESLFI